MEIKQNEIKSIGWTSAHFVERWRGSGKLDNKGREIGYVVGTNQNDDQFAAWVQHSVPATSLTRKKPDNGRSEWPRKGWPN